MVRPWTIRHRTWLGKLIWDQPSDEIVFTECLMAIELLAERLRVLDKKLGEVADSAPYRERVVWLRCFRGIDTVSAMTVLAEIHAVDRFERSAAPTALRRAGRWIARAFVLAAKAFGSLAACARAAAGSPIWEPLLRAACFSR